MLRKKTVWLTIFLFTVLQVVRAQQQYGSLTEALQSYYMLSGKPGPRSVNWIKGGEQYSFIAGTDIHTFDPKTGEEKTVFSNSGLHFPGTDRAFDYESFEWSKDSRHLVFRSNFRHIYRRSGISDYYIYDVDSHQLRQAVKDARSAELSPDGSSVGMERNGNLFVYNFATGTGMELVERQPVHRLLAI